MKQATSVESFGIGRIWLVFILGMLAAFGPLTMDMYLPGFLQIADDFQTNASSVQLSLTAALLGIACGQIIVGPLSDAKGRKNPLLFALIFYIAASIFCVISPNIWIFIIVRFFQGLAASAGVVISRAMVRDLYSGPELTKFFALLMLINGLAPILAPVFGGFVLKYTDWYMIFVVLAFIGLIMLGTVKWVLPETLPEDHRMAPSLKRTFVTFYELLKDKNFIGFALVQGLLMAGMFAYISGTPFIFQGIYGVSPQTYSFLFALNGLGLYIFTQVTGRLAGKIAEMKLLFAGLAISFAGSSLLLLMILIKAPLLFIVIPLFFAISSLGMTNTASFSLAMQKQGHRAGSASALLGLLPFLLGAISAPLVGIAGKDTAVPLGIILVCTSLGALCSYFFLIKKASSSESC